MQTCRSRTLLGIVELGGYPNLVPLYQRLDFDSMSSLLSARPTLLKKQLPDIVVAEYNFQSDFRDRTSNLETLMARLQRHPRVRVVGIYQAEFRHKLDQMLERFPSLCGTAPCRWTSMPWKTRCGGRWSRYLGSRLEQGRFP